MTPTGHRPEPDPALLNPPADGTILQHPAPPRGVLVSGHFNQTQGYRVIRQRGAGSWLLTFTLEGAGLYRQKNVQLTAAPGDAVLLAPESYNDYGVPADSSPGAFWHFHWIHFLPRDTAAPWLPWPQPGAGLYHVQVPDEAARVRIAQAFERIHSDLVTAGPATDLLVYSALDEILHLITRAGNTTAPPVDPRIAAALERIRANLAGDHSVEALAQAVALSPSRFAHLFKEQLGESVTQTVLKLRIQQAQRLLSFTDERISDIAYALGFQSPFYFSKQFRLWTHLSPRAYRKKLRE